MDLASPPIRIWAVSDGRAGIEAQALGLAEAVARIVSAEVRPVHLNWRRPWNVAPWWLHPGATQLLQSAATEALPDDNLWPDVWIGTGRASLPLSRRVRSLSQGRSLVVQTQDPRTPLGCYDLVLPPEHDQLQGANVLPLLGSPNRVSAERLAAASSVFQPRWNTFSRPWTAVMIGGASSAYDLPTDHAVALAQSIRKAISPSGGALLLTFSRRTPAAARAAITAVLSDLPGMIWDGSGDNPYFAMLAEADVALVTEDSTNMLTEAATAAKPVLMLPMPGKPGKFARLHDALSRRGNLRRFTGDLTPWPVLPLNETDRAAQEIVRRLKRLQAGLRSQ